MKYHFCLEAHSLFNSLIQLAEWWGVEILRWFKNVRNLFLKDSLGLLQKPATWVQCTSRVRPTSDITNLYWKFIMFKTNKNNISQACRSTFLLNTKHKNILDSLVGRARARHFTAWDEGQDCALSLFQVQDGSLKHLQLHLRALVSLSCLLHIHLCSPMEGNRRGPHEICCCCPPTSQHPPLEAVAPLCLMVRLALEEARNWEKKHKV